MWVVREGLIKIHLEKFLKLGENAIGLKKKEVEKQKLCPYRTPGITDLNAQWKGS